ncbi:sorbitol dehydrogenase [Jackrogersella minutella]|nr:sorbitol dehydrogenase [Jackrogersella minutella]
MSIATKSAGQYLHGANDLRLETRDLSTLGDDEVQVAIRSTTLCGSDLHYYSHYRNGDILVRQPLALGHESAGEITAVGSRVASISPDLHVGDKVAVECGVACGNCDFCKSQRYNICPNLRFRSSGSKFPHYQGTLQERINHPAKWVHKLPDELDYEAGALLEPLAVAAHAVGRAEQVALPSVKKTALIFGAGAVGLLVSVAAQAAGYENIVIADIDEGRLKFATDYGFASVKVAVKPRRGATIEEKLEIAKDTAAQIASSRWPDGTPVGKPSVTFECTGAESCVQASIYATISGGSVVLIGLGVPNHVLPISEATPREITLIPSWRYANVYPRAIEIAAASVTGSPLGGIKLPDIRKLVTHRHTGLDSVEEAFKMAGKTSDANGALVVKTIINF